MTTLAEHVSSGSPAVTLGWQPEADLIRSAQGGDHAAFEALVLHYRERVRMQCLRKGLNPDDASDVQQDVFVKVFRNLPRYRHDTAFQTWLFRVTENCIYDHFRRRGRYLAKHEPLPHDEQDKVMEFPSPAEDPEQLTHASMLGNCLQDALNALSAEQRETFLMKEVRGLKYEEIAALEGCSVGTIKSRVFRARQILMRELEAWI